MKHANFSYVDPNTGNITWEGPLSLQKGEHSHMPPRTEAYLPMENEIGTYDRGHINASSLGGANTTDNITPQHSDLNRAGGAYYAMEQGERTALQNGAVIVSSKTAIVNSQLGDRAEAFMVSDNITYADGHTESIYHSFINASYAEQQLWNDQSAALPDTFDAPNPGDVLGSSMSSSEYAELMENTDAELPGIAEDYDAASFSGVPGAAPVPSVSEDVVADGETADTTTDADVSANCDSSANCDVED